MFLRLSNPSIEIIVGKGENAGFQHFVLFSIFSKGYFLKVCESGECVIKRWNIIAKNYQLFLCGNIDGDCSLPCHGFFSDWHFASEPSLSFSFLFDPKLGQFSFQELMVVVGTRFIPFSPAVHFFDWLCGKAASGLARILCWVLVNRTRGKLG